MVFEIDSFRSAVSAGFQKLEHYRVRFPYPNLMLGQTYANTLNSVAALEFYADSVDFAGVSLATHNINRYGYGPTEKKPVFPQFQDIMITFYADANADNLTFFQAWLNTIMNFNMSGGINSIVTNNQFNTPYDLPGGTNVYEVAYKDEYAVDGWVTMFDNAENPITTLYMRQMYPIHIPEIKMGWALTQDVMRVTVIFTFMDWYIISGDPDNPGAVQNNLGVGPLSESPLGEDANGQNPNASVTVGMPQIVGGQ